jgi:hypothetical protein
VSWPGWLVAAVPGTLGGVTQASPRTRRLFAAGFVLMASAGVHVVSLNLLPRIDTRAPAAPVDIDMIAMTLAAHPTVARDALPTEVAESRDDDGKAEVHEASPPRVVRAAPAAKREVVAADESRSEASPATQSGEPLAAEREAPVAKAPPIDLSARSAALSTLALAPTSAVGPVQRDDLATRRGAVLSAELRAIANADPARDRAGPELVRDADGTCHYAGTAINATVFPDGGVRFEDKAEEVRAVSVQPLDRGQFLPRGGVQMPPERPVTPEEMLPAQQLEFRLRFAARAWKAERDWFLRATEGLRRELADKAQERELVGAEHDLRKQLDQIWCDARVPAADRRRALFEMWDAMSADEIGLRGRRVLLEYIHENLPKDSALAYPDAQLASLNARRAQRDRFDPYGVAAQPADR